MEMPSPLPPPSIDLILTLVIRPLLSPFPPFLLALSLRALAHPFTSPPLLYSTIYTLFLVVLHILTYISQRIAHGPPRAVNLEDEVVVITGGSKGLGRCLAEIYAMKGAGVAVLEKHGGGGDEEEDGIKRYKCDVGDRQKVEQVWRRVVEEVGTPTILINNAAVVNGKPFLELTQEEVEETFHTNTISHYHLASLFLPALLSRPGGGTLVTISSVLAHLGASHLSAYSASKAALTAFHSSLSAELAPYPSVKTILVAPGQLDTGMFAGVQLDPLRAFFAPVVEVREIAVKLVAMIDSGNGGVLALPAYASWIGWYGVLPAGLQKMARWVSGIDTAIGKRTLVGNRNGGNIVKS